MAKKKIEVIIDAETKKIKSKLKDVSKQVDKFGKDAKKSTKQGSDGFLAMAKKVGLVAAAMMTLKKGFKFIKDSLSKFGEQEQIVNRLAVSLGKSTKGLEEYASAMQQVTIYGDEEILMAMNQMSAFTKEEDQIKQLTKATLDMAAAKGMTLVSAGELISKTFGSTTNALTRYGVSVEGAVGSTERLKQITEGIGKLWSGQAKASADTYKGAIIQTHNAIADLQERIGSKFAPAIMRVSKGMKAFTESLFLESDLETTIGLLKEYGTEADIINKLMASSVFLKTGEKKYELQKKLNKLTKQSGVFGWINAKQAEFSEKSELERKKEIEEKTKEIVRTIKELANEQIKLGKMEEDYRTGKKKSRTLLNSEIQAQETVVDNLKIKQKVQSEEIEKYVEINNINKAILNTEKQRAIALDIINGKIARIEDKLIEKKKLKDFYTKEEIKDLDKLNEQIRTYNELMETDLKPLAPVDVENIEEAKGLILELGTVYEQVFARRKEQHEANKEMELKGAALSGNTAIGAMKNVVSAELMEAIAGLLASILKSVPFPFNLLVAAGAGGMAKGLMDKALGAIPDKFASGGSMMVTGSGGADSQTIPIRVSPGERATTIIETPQQINNNNNVQIIGDFTITGRDLHYVLKKYEDDIL